MSILISICLVSCRKDENIPINQKSNAIEYEGCYVGTYYLTSAGSSTSGNYWKEYDIAIGVSESNDSIYI